MMAKREVNDMSGHCRHPSLGSHDYCRAQWETPSAIVTCVCKCHSRRVLVPKGPTAAPTSTRRIVPKS